MFLSVTYQSPLVGTPPIITGAPIKLLAHTRVLGFLAFSPNLLVIYVILIFCPLWVLVGKLCVIQR